MQKAKLINKKLLSQPDAIKPVWQVSLDITNTDLNYQVGDILFILAPNSDEDVQAILDEFNIAPDTIIKINNLEDKAYQLLKYHFELGKVSFSLLQELANNFNDEYLLSILLNKVEIEKFIHSKNNLDLLHYFNANNLDFLAFLKLLKPLQKRAYSISSCPFCYPDQINLTISQESFYKNGKMHFSHFSNYLKNLNIGDELEVELLSNTGFHLPDSNNDILMIGAGTGIAPYIGFLQEREHKKTPANNWLIFGNRHYEKDFLYQEELENWLESGVLNQLDLAFSRDGNEKVYVQNLIHQHSEKIWKLIQKEGLIFLCGNASKMAKAVDQALVDIIQQYTELDHKQAKKYLLNLRKSKRYMRDVY